MSNAARLDLARELHDGIAQDLVALGYELDLLLARPDSSNQSRKEIRGLRFRVDEMISKVRREMYELRDLKMESVQDYLKKTAKQLCGSALTKVAIEEFLINEVIGDNVKVIATELLRNSVSHARASAIELHLSQIENHIYLEVRDNGIGGLTMESSRLGLIGIKERTETLGGVFSCHSDSSGTRVAITL